MASTIKNEAHDITIINLYRKYILIGTRKGSILLFDHNQQLQHILNVDPKYGCVYSALLSEELDTLIVGYKSGALVIWHLSKVKIVKEIIDLHNNSITNISFLSLEEPRVILTIDISGQRAVSTVLF